MTIDRNTLPQLVGRVVGLVSPLLLLVGVLLAAALAVDAFVTRVPGIDGSQAQMLLAALLVFVARQ